MTKYEKARAMAIANELENAHNDGAKGRAFELSCVTASSRKTRVSAQGKADITVRFVNPATGKTYNRPAECKTNGGRIGQMVKDLENGKDGLIIYRLSYSSSTTKGKLREVEPIIVPFSMFYKMLNECKALKSTNGTNPEIAVQPSSKKMYLRLEEWVKMGYAYEIGKTYSNETWGL